MQYSTTQCYHSQAYPAVVNRFKNNYDGRFVTLIQHQPYSHYHLYAQGKQLTHKSWSKTPQNYHVENKVPEFHVTELREENGQARPWTTIEMDRKCKN